MESVVVRGATPGVQFRGGCEYLFAAPAHGGDGASPFVHGDLEVAGGNRGPAIVLDEFDRGRDELLSSLGFRGRTGFPGNFKLLPGDFVPGFGPGLRLSGAKAEGQMAELVVEKGRA